MKFGIYLVRNGLIDADQLVDALEEQELALAPLGQIAIESGKLSVREVFRVLREQIEEPRERFGETAVQFGMLKPSDVAELMMIQMARRTPLEDILLRQGVLTHDRIYEALIAYRTELRGVAAVLDVPEQGEAAGELVGAQAF